MQRYNQFLPDRQIERLRELKEQTSLPVAELMRRMFDHCFQEHVLNSLVPSMSGHIGRQP